MTWRMTSRQRSIAAVTCLVLLFASSGCDRVVSVEQVEVSYCSICGSELSRTEKMVDVRKSDLAQFQATVKGKSGLCPWEWSCLTACNIEQIERGTAVSEQLVNHEPHIRVVSRHVPDSVGMRIGPIQAEKLKTGTYQVRRLDLLEVFGASAPPKSIHLILDIDGGEIGSLSLPFTLKTATHLVVEPIPRNTWATSVAIGGRASPGATVTCEGRSVLADDGACFLLTVPLSTVGSHSLAVTAARDGEHQAQTDLTVERLPNVVVNTPEAKVSSGIVRVTGVVNPSYTVEVQGAKCEIPESGHFSATVMLTEGERVYIVPVIVKNGGTVVYNQSFSVNYIGPMTQAAIATYRTKTGEIAEQFGEYLGDLGKLCQSPRFFSNDWIMSVAFNAAMMRITMDEHRELVPPQILSDVHKTMLMAWTEYGAYLDLLLQGIDALSASKIDAAGVRLRKGNAYIGQALEMLLEVAQ